MKISILCPRSEFTNKQQKELTQVGEIVYTASRNEHPIEDLISLTENSEILAVDPDILGGFEKAQDGRLTKLMENLPKLKGVSLATTSFCWIDLDYCRKRGIKVTNVPHYSTESVAEQVLGLLICLAKKIILLDRKTQQGKYNLEMGFELRGKTLGVIGLGQIGSRVAELGNAIGMKVIAYNRSLKKLENVEMKSLNEVLTESDAISLNLACNKETNQFISEEKIKKMKAGVIIVNMATRELVDEQAMAKALKSGKVASYAYEGEDLKSGPLGKIETAIGLPCFSWYTKEAYERANNIWTKSIVFLARGNPINIVN